MKKTLTLIIATTLMTLMNGAQLTMALTVDTEKPTPEMKKAFSAEAFESKDKSKEGLCSGIGDFKNKNCPQLVQGKSNKIFENNGKQEEVKVVEVVVEKPVYVPVASEEKSKKEEKQEEKVESKDKGKVLGASTVRPAAPQPVNDNSQQIMLLTVLMVLTLVLTLITEVRTQKVIQQIQTQLSRKKRGGKTSKK